MAADGDVDHEEGRDLARGSTDVVEYLGRVLLVVDDVEGEHEIKSVFMPQFCDVTRGDSVAAKALPIAEMLVDTALAKTE